MNHLEQALTVDVALSERQVARHYGLSLEACSKGWLQDSNRECRPNRTDEGHSSCEFRDARNPRDTSL